MSCHSYGPGQAGIERCDLLVGDMYEKKPEPAFALSETSFIIFLLMASRRLDADPYLNQNFNEKFYTEFGLKHLNETEGLFDLLERHYPALAKDFKGEDGKRKQSAFKPTLGAESWDNAIEKGVVPESITKVWKETKEANDKFFDEVEEESKNFYKNLKSNGSPPVTTQNIYVLISVLLFVVSVFLHQAYYDYEPLRKIGIRQLWPVSMDPAKELGYSNVRHKDSFLRVRHILYQNDLCSISLTTSSNYSHFPSPYNDTDLPFSHQSIDFRLSDISNGSDIHSLHPPFWYQCQLWRNLFHFSHCVWPYR